MMTAGVRERIESLLQIDPGVKPDVYVQIFRSAEIFSLNYILELLLAASIATLGLVLNSPAVVIGAMLISPLMGPIMAAGLALAASDLYLGIKSLIGIALSVLLAVGFSAGLVWLIPFHSPTSEILARTQPNLLDLAVALFSGLAGSIVLSRGGKGGGITALPGVAIAVALMPPLCTVGFGFGSGNLWPVIQGASLLFITNLVAIVASAFVVFFVVRMDSPDVRLQIEFATTEAASGDLLFQSLQQTSLSGSLRDLGHMRWRVLMLLISFAMLYLPLSEALDRLKDETVSRGAVREALRGLGTEIVTQKVSFDGGRVSVQAMVAEPVAEVKLHAAEQMITQRTGKRAQITVRRVAVEDELAALSSRLESTVVTPAAPPTLEAMRTDVLGRIDAPLREAWPADSARLLGYEVALTPGVMIVRIQAESAKAIDPAVPETLARMLRAKLADDRIVVEVNAAQAAQATTKPAQTASRRARRRR